MEAKTPRGGGDATRPGDGEPAATGTGSAGGSTPWSADAEGLAVWASWLTLNIAPATGWPTSAARALSRAAPLGEPNPVQASHPGPAEQPSFAPEMMSRMTLAGVTC